jgi:hypothetical protein
MSPPDAPYGFFIELLFIVHGFPDGAGTQRLIVSVNGREIGTSIVRGRVRLAWNVPPLPQRDSHMVINFGLPDAIQPSHGSDQRYLGISATSLRIMKLLEPMLDFPVRITALTPANEPRIAKAITERMTTLTPAQLALNFESLGVNCEPGFFQRKCGVEPLGLLRFSGVLLHSLVNSIDDGFAGLGDAAKIDPVPDESDLKDWVIYERRHLLRYHTWVRVSDATIDELKNREAKRLPFLKRKFFEDLEEGRKIFIHLDNRVIPDEELWPLFLAIRRRGRGRLLCIGPAAPTNPAGMVQEIAPGLMRGYFSHFSVVEDDLSMTEWLAICCSAWLLGNSYGSTI